MCPIELRTKPIFRIFHILKTAILQLIYGTMLVYSLVKVYQYSSDFVMPKFSHLFNGFYKVLQLILQILWHLCGKKRTSSLSETTSVSEPIFSKYQVYLWHKLDNLLIKQGGHITTYES